MNEFSMWIGIIVGIFSIIGGISAYTFVVFKLGKFTASLNENTRMTIETYNVVKSHETRLQDVESNKVDKVDFDVVVKAFTVLQTQHSEHHKGA